MLNIYYRTIKDEGITRLEEIRPGVWVDAVEPTDQEKEFLGKQGIEAELINDALDPDELPRIEKEDGVVYAILTVPERQEGRILNIPLLVAITKEILVTVSSKDLGSFKVLLGKNVFYTTQKAKNLIQICILVTELYTKEIMKINKEISNKKVNLSKLKNMDIIAFVELEEALSEFVTSLLALIGIFEKILSGKYLKTFKEDEDLLKDLIIDSRQGLDMCQASIKKIINIRDAYSAILSNNLNRVMKIVASLTLIMGVPTVIASFYGMNIALPIQNHPLAFLYVFLITLISSLVLVFIFRFKNWL